MEPRYVGYFPLFIVVFLAGAVYTECPGNPRTAGLLAAIESSAGVAWIAPHCDDEIYASGLLALASLGFKKRVFVVSLNKNASATQPGTLVDRHRDNRDFKEYLELEDYIYAKEHLDRYRGNFRQKLYSFLDEFMAKNGIGVVLTFENTHGANGHPDHLKVSDLLTAYTADRNVSLYYFINRDPGLNRREPGHALDPLPVTDTLDLDAYTVKKDGKALSLWQVKMGVVEIYSSSQPGCHYLVQHPEALERLAHKEWYRKVN